MCKAYALVLQIEQQKECNVVIEMKALNIGVKGEINIRKPFDKKKASTEKKDMICKHCKKRGHGKDTFFKIHGTLEWLKEMIEKKHVLRTNVVSGSTSTSVENKDHGLSKMNLRDLIREEMMTMMNSP